MAITVVMVKVVRLTAIMVIVVMVTVIMVIIVIMVTIGCKRVAMTRQARREETRKIPAIS